MRPSQAGLARAPSGMTRTAQKCTPERPHFYYILWTIFFKFGADVHFLLQKKMKRRIHGLKKHVIFNIFGKIRYREVVHDRCNQDEHQACDFQLGTVPDSCFGGIDFFPGI